VTPAIKSVLILALRTPQASLAVVFEVSSPRSVLISLQVVSHSTCTPSAAVWSAASVSTHALTVAWAVDVAGVRPLHPWAAAWALLTALHPPFDSAIAAIDPARTRPGTYFILRLFMKALLGRPSYSPGGTDRPDHD
jgi:hypothetical protein